MTAEHINPVGLAISDMRVATAVLRRTAGVIRAIDVRDLAGFRAADGHSDEAVDIYCGAVDAALSRLPGLSNRGYKIERA